MRNRTSAYYIGTDDFLVKTSVTDDRKIRITFTEECTLRVDSIKVYWYPTNQIAEWADKLGKEHLENLQMETDRISGSLNASQDSWMFFSIPYSEGWTAYVDGRKTEIEKANIGFMAFPVEAGSHGILLVYHAPGSLTGRLIAVSGWIIFGILLIVGKNERRNKNACVWRMENQ